MFGESATTPARRRRRSLWLLVSIVAAGLACGKRGAPLPPEPRGPLAPRVVAARQIGASVEIRFQVPRSRGPRPAQQPVRAELVRVSYAPGPEPPQDPDAFRRRGEVVHTMEGDPLPPGAATLVDRTVSELPRQGIGRTLRYGVRVRDRRGRPSPLVTASDLVLLEPRPAPGELEAETTADGIRLVWSPPPDAAGETRYNVYRATAAGRLAQTPLNAEPLTRTEYLDGTITIGESYRYEVRVVLADGKPYREGIPSAQREVLAEDLFAPAAPLGLVAVQEGPAVRLFWDPNRERDLAGYRVYRRIGDGEWRRIGPDPVEQPLYLDGDVGVGQRLRYRVTAIDRSRQINESDPSVAVDVDLGQEPVGGGLDR